MQPDANRSSIFTLKEKDAALLAGMEAACFSTAWSADRYAELLRACDGPEGPLSAAFCVFGMRSGSSGLDAYISLGLHQTVGEIEIYNIAVRDDRRQHGFGKKLLVHALREAALAGFTRALLEVRTGNTAALALYASTGFRECGRRKGYYADTGEDALVLSRDLP